MKAYFKKIPVCLMVSVALSCFMGMAAFAAVEKIDTVKLAFSYGQTPKAGEALGEVTGRAESKEFTVDRVEYTNETDVWRLGERPEVQVTMTAEEGYGFSYTSAGHFKLSGCGAEFRKAKVYDGGNTLVLEVYFKGVDGKVGEVQGLEWDHSYGMWEALEEDIKYYEVRLYRNKNLIQTFTTENTAYDFRSYITREGDYTFRVRGIARYKSKTGNWSDDSEESTFTGSEAENYNRGTWIQNRYGWWYRYYNGDYPVSTWKQMDQIWYYFNEDGYSLNGWQKIGGHWYYLGDNGKMVTGWQYINNRWYYMNGDGVMLTGWQYINSYWFCLLGDGAMVTGWQYINDRWYYMNGDGVMLTGWQYINGSWYYLDDSGVMYANRYTPDGYYVDSSGRWQ